jgi:VCBS repeat-containing protein
MGIDQRHLAAEGTELSAEGHRSDPSRSGFGLAAGLAVAVALAAPGLATAGDRPVARSAHTGGPARGCMDGQPSVSGAGRDNPVQCRRSRKRRPVARKDKARTSEDSRTKINVLKNDRDRHRRSLKIVAVKDRRATGSVKIIRRGSRLRYDPDGGFEALAAGQTASDTFTYKVKNRRGKRDSARVTVKIKGADDPSTFSTSPPLYPEYSPAVSDYVTRCSGDPVEIEVNAGPGNEIAVDGGPPRNGTFSTEVPLQANQRFSFVRTTGAGSSTHHVRCLPGSFPEWSFESFAPAEQQFYLLAVGDYVFVLDGNGVPLWWFDDGGGAPADAKYLADGTIAWASDRATANARYEIRALDGSPVRELKTVATMTDGHDMQLLDNGNYLLMSYRQRAGTVDLSAYGGSADATVLDAELQEIEPDGSLLWSWNSKDHIDLAETDHWFDDFPHTPVYDLVHINAAQRNGDSLLISLRHTDGVYKIDRSTGDIVWKLGGTTTPESLTVVDDPYGQNPFGGQHDAHLLADGTLVAFDNGMTRNRPPRAVRYEIDEGAGTATLLESVADPEVGAAICCGSARRSPAGGWTVGWGSFPDFNPITEFAADGSRTFKLSFTDNFSYRAAPVPFGELGRAALRGGMDAQHPR